MKLLKYSRLFFAAGAVLAMMLLLSGCGWLGGNPQIAVSPATFDFGPINPNDPVTTTFAVSNQGSGALQIDSVTTSCGCTTAQISRQSIEPNSAADLSVTFDPQVHAGATGEFVRYVYLRTNDPNNPEFEVEIRAEVVENSTSEEASR